MTQPEKHLLLITYTIFDGGDDSDLVRKLERADSYEIDETAWLVYSPESPRWWYSQLEPLIYDDDELMILKVSIHDIASDEGTESDLDEWLRKHGGYVDGI